jgi:hypothetical protein
MPFDVFTLGETMVRYTPKGFTRLEEATELEQRVGGSESNVAVALSRLGLRVVWASRLPRNPLGELVARRLLSGYDPRLEIEGFGRAALLFVSNHAVFTYAGRVPLRFSPAAHFDLGLDLIAPEEVGRLTAARLAGRLAIGRGLTGAPGVLAGHDLDRIVVRCDEPLALQADGEDLGDVTEAVFEAERDAIDVLV